MTDWIRPFRGEPNCPKCGAARESVLTEWHTAVVIGHCDSIFEASVILSEDADVLSDPCTEHLCRACQRCTFCWCERTADYE